MNPVLTIDPEFESKCPPLTGDELAQLEENILEEGLVLMPLIVWNDTIVDGHNRYRIAQAHPGIAFRTHEKRFNNRYEALSWIQLHGGDRKSEQAKSSSQNGNLISPLKTCDRIAEETNTSKNYVIRAEHFSNGIDAAEEVLPCIKNDLLLGKYKPRETDVAAVARASPEERREKAEQLRVIPEKKPKADNNYSQRNSPKRRQDYAEIDQIYDELKAPKCANEDSAMVSLRYVARNMIESCDSLFGNFPGLLSKPAYKVQVVEIMQKPKQYIINLEGEEKT